MIEIKSRMTPANFIASIRSNILELATLWDCSEFSFRDQLDDPNKAGVYTGETLLKSVGYNLRSDDFYDWMDSETFVNTINDAFEKKDIRRFQDYHIANIATNVQEPSAIVTDDGDRLDLLGGRFYTYTEDGFNFAEPCGVSFENPSGYLFACYNYFKHDGKVYCTTATRLGTTPVGIVLWEEKDGNVWGETSTQKVFTNPTVIYPYDGGDYNNFGNTFVIERNGDWYLLIEVGGPAGHGYEIFLASSSSLNGTYTLVQNDPIIVNPEYALTIAANSAGNPDIVMLRQDTPYMCDGKYYLIYHHMMHTTTKSFSYLYRAYSYDLIHWTVEAPIMSGRHNPELDKLTNADACWCEFKGRSYLFYMRNANQYLDPSGTEPSSINACVDFRPMSELLRIKP